MFFDITPNNELLARPAPAATVVGRCFLLAVLLVSVAACGDTEDPPGTDCVIGSDCPPGQTCSNGFCELAPDEDVPPSEVSDASKDAVPSDVLEPDADAVVEVADDVQPVDTADDATDDVGDDVGDDTTPDAEPDAGDVEEDAPEDIEADAADGEDDTGDEDITDAGPEDVPVDTLEDVEADVLEDVIEDVPEDVVEDVEPDVEEDVAPPGPADLGEICDGNCLPGYMCKPQADGFNRCELFPGGVCAPCKKNADCLGENAKCLLYPGGSSFCGSYCNGNDDCPGGFLCVSNQCKPLVGFCECKANIFGWSLPCSNSSDLGFCEGSILCLASGWSTCSAVYPSPEVCDGIDNDCNGLTDEGILLYEKGLWLNIGDDCGLGQCGPGEVICGPDGTAVCSSGFFAAPESCTDVVDNDCDGYINEECESPDYDGDGTPNEEDCQPTDAGFYPGAPESCCPPDLGNDPSCDTNCDLEVTACEPCDTDFDGHCPPDDCDDADATVYPGAPEKCDDGIDQNCQGGDLLCPPFQDQDGDGYIPPADCGEGNPNIYPGAEELCDNQDNDCDGLKDEGNPGGGDVCGEGEDFCQSGINICSHTDFAALIQCVGATPYGIEKCDGKDNDCNGVIDDTWPNLGEACDGPDLDECANGVFVCKGDGSDAECGPEFIENIVETCNDLDDDCDGATDEFVCPIDDVDADGFTTEDGDCDDFRAEVFPGAVEPCCDPALGGAGVEICDLNCDEIVLPCALADKDSDGFTPDEGDCNDASDKIYPGSPEICGDGIDQDCTVGDLDCALVTDGDGDGYHVGVDCNDANPDIHPWATEICNFVDDDCDGIVDDGNPVENQGPCGVASPGCKIGQWVCVHDLATYTTQVLCANDQFQTPEVCNGLDDDCDGDIDESYFEIGEACDGPDQDSCANGAYQCTEDGLGVECGPEDVEDLPELCDGLDNDCDGDIDEDLNFEGIPLNAPCQGIGACGPGVVVCKQSGEVVCSTNPDGPFSQVKDELCNGLDDDCDGETDEGFSWQGLALGETCEGLGVCGTGVVECGNLDLPTCSTHADGSESQASDEICNLEDDDCDGLSDEELGLASSPCKVEGLCAAGTVAATCVQGQWDCDYSDILGYQVEETLCDTLDNDCDGEADEGMAVGQVCDGPDSDECETGTWTCGPGGQGVLCLDEIITDIVEVCNGFDDDCDGLVDEVEIDPALAGCNTTGVCSLTWAVTVYCGVGQNVCDYSQIPFFQAEETLCDGLDNDCDGLVDEGLDYDGLPLGSLCQGKGECGTGVVQCSVLTKVPICSTEEGGFGDQSSAEKCNGLDDDCDGLVDEDFVWQGAPVGNFCNPGGICGTGVVECSADKLSSNCSTAAGGSQDQTLPEECDGQDNDCDGETDEIGDLDVQAAGCPTDGVCSDLTQFVSCQDGLWICDVGLLPAYQDEESGCDGLDNDCDGEVDEAFPELGLPCDGPDEGACPTGTWTCTDLADGLECVNESGIGKPEICDGADNDCDGLVDEGMNYQGVPLGFLCDGMGPCGIGYVECGANGSPTCSTHEDGSQSQATAEICNGVDDNCDGVIDDGLDWEGTPLGQPCDGTGGCGLGFVECSPLNGQPTCSTNPDGSDPKANVEICNGVDDDCDGDIDEAVADLGQRCDGPDFDACKTGLTSCEDGKITCGDDVACVFGSECFDPGEPFPEICLCSGQACSIAMGDSCALGGCSCAGGPTCFQPTVCIPGVGCQ